MGIWNWLLGRRSGLEMTDDVVWLRTAAKQEGLRLEIRKRLRDTPLTLLVAHFPATLEALRQHLAEHSLPSFHVEERLTPGDLERRTRQEPNPQILLALAKMLATGETPVPLDPHAPALRLLVAERHFLRLHDDLIVSFARGAGRPCRLTFQVSLDDSLLRAVGGDWIPRLLARLGMSDSDPIESPLVAHRIQSAQALFARQGMDEREADSANDWLRLNRFEGMS